jgi:hypothetical protein
VYDVPNRHVEEVREHYTALGWKLKFSKVPAHPADGDYELGLSRVTFSMPETPYGVDEPRY